MKVANFLGIVMFSAVFAFATSALSQVRQVPPRHGRQSPPGQADPNAPPQVRQVQPGHGQQSPPGQTDPNALPQVRKVAPRGSAPQAMKQRGANQQVPRYQMSRQLSRRWKLGIDDSVSPLGVMVSRVNWHTPASDQLGLERGDYILDVGGSPVGYHQGTYYGLSDLLNMKADRQGWVNINIWNRRTGQDAAQWVQLERVSVHTPGRSNWGGWWAR